MQELIARAKELLADGTVARVIGWKAGDLPYNPEPAYFEKEEDMEESLKRLENIQSIVLEDGCYHISETILN